MKKYKVVVNGTSYEVEIELMNETEATAAAAPSAPAVAPSAPSAAPAAGGEKVSAPMPGTILSVACENGKSVKRGDVLFVLEAMKMENEIMSPADGTVSSLSVSSGAAVKSGDLLCVIA
ncbi:MAG: biotin/lipoyl-binding protein [Clostridia bacterium]|nr:biotin/lipoyl-binding protein [Clostridia bacterium]